MYVFQTIYLKVLRLIGKEGIMGQKLLFFIMVFEYLYLVNMRFVVFIRLCFVIYLFIYLFILEESKQQKIFLFLNYHGSSCSNGETTRRMIYNPRQSSGGGGGGVILITLSWISTPSNPIKHVKFIYIFYFHICNFLKTCKSFWSKAKSFFFS